MRVGDTQTAGPPFLQTQTSWTCSWNHLLSSVTAHLPNTRRPLPPSQRLCFVCLDCELSGTGGASPCASRPPSPPVPYDLLKPKRGQRAATTPAAQHSHAGRRQRQGTQHSLTARASRKSCPDRATEDLHVGPQQGNSTCGDAVSHQNRHTNQGHLIPLPLPSKSLPAHGSLSLDHQYQGKQDWAQKQ